MTRAYGKGFKRSCAIALILGLTLGATLPAVAGHYRDSYDSSSYWSYSNSGGTMYLSTGGKVLNTSVRKLRYYQQWTYTTDAVTNNGDVDGSWIYTNQAWAGEVKAWMTCSGYMTSTDAHYYAMGGNSWINQNAYCNNWVSVLAGPYVNKKVFLNNFSDLGNGGTRVGFDGLIVYW